MRQFPDLNDKYDVQDLEILNVEQWQVDLLKVNPEYVFWGNYEDHMSGKGSGWGSPVECESWDDFNWGLDDLNECVNFYFKLHRENHECPHCEGSNYNKETKQLSDDWYDFGDTGRRWSNNITDVEIEALMKHGRLSDVSNFNGYFDKEKNVWVQRVNGKKIECEKPEMPTAIEVNNWSRHGMGHDAINRIICVEARAKHLGVYGHCEHCTEGYIYDEPKGNVGLQLWILHPRKGCSRGVYIKQIKQENLPDVFAFLKNAAERNQKRFSKIK